MKQASTFEYDFRRLAADRALGDVRAAIVKREVIYMKKKHSHTKKTTETIERRIHTVSTEIAELADHYRRHWVLLRAMGLPESDPDFRPLRDDDLIKFEISTAQNAPGQSREKVSWLWGDFKFVDAETDSRYQDFYNDGEFEADSILLCRAEQLPFSSSRSLVPLKCLCCALEGRSQAPSGGDAPDTSLPRVSARQMERARPCEDMQQRTWRRRICPEVRT